MAELADVFSDHGAAYRAKFADRMPPSHAAAMRDIGNCRTPALGGSLYACPHCPDILEYSYHSCGNRSCPKCGNERTTKWLETQCKLLLPTDYFLVTFTLPEECREVARSHQKAVYSAFFRASASAFLGLARQPKHLGGLAGMAGILQTWRRDMGYHPHIHYIVPGGALSADGRQWLPHRYRDWLLPEKALAAQFKLRFKAELETLGLTRLVSPKVWRYDKKWVADCIPAGCGEQALKYVAPYVYRVAISNNRIEKLEDGMVTFRFKDGTSGEWKHLTLSAEEFIRRFLQHVLPRGFVKVRYYGFLSTRSRGTLLPVIRRLAAEDGNPAGHDPSPDHARLDPVPREHRCPQCGRTMILLRRFHPTPAARGPP